MALIFHGMRIVNFKAYSGEHHIDFRREPGLYFVRGDNRVDPELEANAAGKTSIFDAMSWCLYGKTLRDERPGDSVEPYTGEKPTIVATSIQRDNDFYLITRQRNPNRLTHRKNKGDEIDSDQAQIDEIVGLPYKLFRCTIMLPQFGEMFLDLTPEEQAALLSDALDLDVWLRAADLSGGLLKDIRGDLDALKAKMAGNEGRMLEIAQQIEDAEASASQWNEINLNALAEIKQGLAVREQQAVVLRKQPEPAENTETTDLWAKKNGLLLKERQDTKEKIEVEGEIAALVREQRELTAKINAYKTGSKCPECGQKVPASHIAAKREPLDARFNEVGIALHSWQIQLPLLTAALNDLKSKLAKIDADIAASVERYDNVNATALANQRRLEVLTLEIAGLLRDKKRFETQVNPHKTQIEISKTRQRQIEAEAKVNKTNLESLEWSAASYEYLQGSFRQIRLDLIDGCLGEIEVIANQEAQALGLNGWQMKLATERETTQGKIARKMAVLIYPPGSREPVRLASYCGGEDQRWQLAARFALSEVLLAAAGIEPSIEILDEPSVHLSPKGVEDLMVLLRNRAKRLGRQILVCDHHILDENLFDGILDVWKDAEGSHAQWADAPDYGVGLHHDPMFDKESVL